MSRSEFPDHTELLYSTTRRRRPPAGEMSIISARTSPTIGQRVHWPWNQCCTAVYQSSVVGRKMKPRMGQRVDGNTPSNHRLKNQSNATRSRGVASARIARRQGMDQPMSRRKTQSSGAAPVRPEDQEARSDHRPDRRGPQNDQTENMAHHGRPHRTTDQDP